MAVAGCGPRLPPRFVIEQDLGAYRYSRYQQVLDIEVPIEGNPAVGHTATYVRGATTLSVVPVFVTVYERASGLTETLRGRLRDMPGYEIAPRQVAGEHVLSIRGEGGDLWLCWISDRHVVKLGTPEGKDDVPEEVVEAYLDLYPSDLDDRGRARKGASSAGAAVARSQEQKP
jgi:hypothetical protein